LTGLLNRRAFSTTLDSELARFNRREGRLCVLTFDIDHFKLVNDLYGHEAGDQVLQRVSRIAERVNRQGDVLARWGGEEFMMLLCDTDSSGARVIARRLQSELADDETLPSKLTVSIGIAEAHCGSESSDLLRRADRAMYQAKRQGRDCIVTADAIVSPG
jgi:diguanylate cyclase (GGDEF)-like protein